MTGCIFISDLHLDISRPRATAAFLRFLQTDARLTERLYILGDLFEVWLGDDSSDPYSDRVLDELSFYTKLGHECLFMRGNRDFMVGQRFSRYTGIRLLDDPTVEMIYGERVLVMHGDLLCTDDQGYQRFRRIVRNPIVQRGWLALPLATRRALAARARQRSRELTAGKPPAIMDVNAAAVESALRTHGVSLLLHGHTHRPGVHRLTVDGRPATRIVLGDWYEQGSMLEWSAAGYQLRTVPFS